MSHEYITREELKVTLELEDTDYADADIDLAVEAASRAIDGYKHTRFYPTDETRYYTAACHQTDITIDDAISLTAVTVDTDGNGSYDTTWTENTDFYLDPANANIEGLPVRRLVLRRQAGRVFPSYARSIKVEGSFGWTEAPVLVKQATKILASRLLKRSRETPYGILTIAGDVASAARLGRIDPDVAFLLDQLPGSRTTLFV